MRLITLVAFAMILVTADPSRSEQQKPVKVIEKYLYAIAEKDATSCWEALKQVKEKQINSLEEVQAIMRFKKQPTWIKVRVGDKFQYLEASNTKEVIDKIECRVDSLADSEEGLMYNCSAFTTRTLTPVEKENMHLLIVRKVVMKIYMTVLNDQLIRFHNDEIQMETELISSE